MCARYYYIRKGPFIFYNIKILTRHGGLFLIVILYSKLQRWVIDIGFIIGYYTVKIERVSDRYLFYYNFLEIEEQKLHLLLLYIKCMSVVWERVVSAHGASTALNRELLSIFLFLFVYINFIYSCLRKA